MSALPPVDEVTRPWWDATREQRLLLQRCPGCSSLQHPPRALCTSCGGTDLGWAESAGHGAVDASTVVERAPRPDLHPPYVVARVRLDEGPLLLTNVVTPTPYDVGIDTRVRLAWRPLDDGRHLPVFTPEPTPEQEQ